MPTAYSYVRFSTQDQAFGDSERRQLDAARQWAAANGYTLADASLFDQGVSSFRGRNAKEGALGAFLASIEAGEVKRGSALIIEELDRLSRQPPMMTVELVKKIIYSGVNLAVLSSSTIITKANVSDLDVWVPFAVSISLAHQESVKKSQRIKATYKNRRLDAIKSGKPIPGRYPFWITRVGDKFELNDGAETVRTIFKLREKGLGVALIISELAKLKIPPPNAKQWYGAFIKRILKNPAVVGRISFNEDEWTEAGKVQKVATGQTAENYYPPVISEAQFNKVNFARVVRKRKGRIGRVDMLTGLCVCGYCGATIMKQNHIQTEAGKLEYLQCSKAATKQGCPHRLMWSKGQLVNVLLQIVDESEGFKKSRADTFIDDITPRIVALDKKIEAAVKDYEATASRMVAQSLKRMEDQKDELLKQLSQRKTVASVTAEGFDEFVAAVKADDAITVNAFLRQFIKDRGISIYSEGDVPGVKVAKPHRAFVIHYLDGSRQLWVERRVLRGERMAYINARRGGKKVTEPTNSAIRQKFAGAGKEF
jgi:DNA invertase Pin-like site-specific DNA recombinase